MISLNQASDKDNQKINNQEASMNQEIDQVNVSSGDDGGEQFIVKRTELSEVIYFVNELLSNSQASRSFSNFFGDPDIEMVHENSLFSVTIIDHKDNNSIVGIFIFNDTPFAPIKFEGASGMLGQGQVSGFAVSPGMWEDWFLTYYEDQKINGKNSLWLVYFCIDEKYTMSEDILKKLFHKIHLSMYTTLAAYDSVLFLLSKVQYAKCENLKMVDTKQDTQDIVAFLAINTMLKYLYEQLNEINPDDKNIQSTTLAFAPNKTAVFLNRRTSVFPLIEIRTGAEHDHDDLENIFKDQTAPEITNLYEDFFIAKMIARQDKDNQVLVGQVGEKAIGMLSLSTDVNVPFLIQNYELESYDNLVKKDYMNAVKVKRKQISTEKEKASLDENNEIKRRYKQEIKKTERIAQRIKLQEYIATQEEYIVNINEIEKNASSKEELDAKMAVEVIKKVLENYEIITPNLDQFEKKIKVTEGECLLADKFHFLIETLEFFGLPRGYMQGNGHWDDWLEKEAMKKAAKEQFRKKLFGGDIKKKGHKALKKENEEPLKPKHFDFSPLGKALELFKDANLRVRTFLRRIVRENKNLIAGFFVNELGEPSEEKCFDVMSLSKKLIQARIAIPPEFGNKIGPILLCFGGLPFKMRTISKIPEEEVIVVDKKEKDSKKKKAQAKKKDMKDEEEKKREPKSIQVTVYEVSISDFFKAIEKSFDYDKLMYEIGEITDQEFENEYQSYMESMNEKYLQSLQVEKSLYQQIQQDNLMKNELDSMNQLKQYAHILDSYDNESAIPPTPPEVLNAFCVKLFFIEQAFESRSTDFLMQAFDLFPDKDYLVLTQPHSFIENSLLEIFIKVEKKVDSLFGDVLFILHRESLMISLLKVNYATVDDLIESAYLFESLREEGESMFQMAYTAIQNQQSSKFVCVCAKINSSIIGISLLSKEVSIAYYDSHFTIRDYSNLDKISKYFHSRIVFYLSHKNFTQYTKLIMKEIIRLINKTSLYYEISPDIIHCPRFVKDMILARNRKFPHFLIQKWHYEKEVYEDDKIKTRTDGEEREELDEIESTHCLVYSSKKMLTETKIANNNRIVIVGSSDAGISFIESLLSIRYLEFAYIYIISASGLLYHHIHDEIYNLKVSMNNYQIKDLKKLLLEHRIKIINSKVIDIKPKQKYIQLEDKSILNYDYLILTLGLQDRLWNDIKLISFKQLDDKFNDFKQKQDDLNHKDTNYNKNLLQIAQKNLKDHVQDIIFSIDDPNIYQKFAPYDRKVISLRKNPKYEIILYGRSLNLLCFIQGLIKRDVPCHKIKLVIPNILFDHPVNKEEKVKSKKDQNINDDLLFINGNSLEDCKELEEYLLKNLVQMGVQVYENFNFGGVNLKLENFTDPTNVKNEVNDLEIASFKFNEDGKDHSEALTGNIIVTGGMIDVDPTVFKFIHENGLVYNGRAIIDKNFLTADSCIFAAGRLCEFSQRYSYTEKFKLLKLESYNSQEVGYTLAKHFLQTIDSQLNVDNSVSKDKKIPTFYLPLPLGCYLPNDLLFFKVKAVKETNPKVLDKGISNPPLIFNNLQPNGQGCYLSFTFNSFGIIDCVTYLGNLKIDYRSIVSLVGLHENYLNQLLERYEVKLVQDIPQFLSENWAMAMFHDKFSQLVIKLKSILQEPDVQNLIHTVINQTLSVDRISLKSLLSRNISEATQQKIEFEILNFLSENRNQLPFYYIPLK